MQTYSSIYRSSIDMILKVTSNFKIPYNMYMSFTAQLFITVSVSINLILSIIIKHVLLIMFCNDDRDQML